MINWKRAVIIGVVLWVLIFFEVSILMFGFNLNSPDPNYYFIHYLLSAIFVITLSSYYFNGKKIKKGLVEGIVLGIVFVAIGVILDSVITIPLFIKDWAFLLSPKMLASYLLGIILTTIVGLIQGIKK